MYIFKYKVRFYNDIDHKYELAEGYVFAEREPEAMEHLAAEYGADDIDRTEITPIDEVFVPIFETKGFEAECREQIEEEMESRPW